MTPDQHPHADEAARYVLGQMPPAARHEFEVQLAQSPELRALVQELEEGVEAAARAVPQRPPPPQTWAAIEQAIDRDVQRKVVPSGWSYWWRSGWAAAAACLVAFLAYAWWPKNRGAVPVTFSTESSAQVADEKSAPAVASSGIAPVHSNSAGRPHATVNVGSPRPPTDQAAAELLSLRRQVAALRSQLDDVSGIVMQQKAILAEPGRFKFFPQSLADIGPDGAAPAALTPELQRAIFYAMARDMGWLPTATPVAASQSGGTPPPVVTAWGIDFVSLNQPTVAALTATDPGASVQGEATEAAATAPISVRPSGTTIPGYLKKDLKPELVLAFDPSIVSPGSTLGFWSGSGGAGHQLIGSAVVGENPMVVTVPADRISEDLTITANPASGPSNVLGGFHIYRYFQLNSPPGQAP